RQDSNVLREGRYFENNSLYGKIDIPLPSDTKLSLTTGYSEPRINTGDLPSSDLATGLSTHVYFATASLASALTDDLSLEVSIYTLKRKSVINTNILGTGDWDPNEEAGELFEQDVFKEKNEGGSGKLVWMSDMQTAVVGAEYSRGRLDNSIRTGEIMQTLYGSPEKVETEPGISKWAVFFNDTISINNFSVTPGIRYDKNNGSGDFISPSLGATYKVDSRTVIRASVARGFTSPSLPWMSGGALWLDPNPDLKPEKVWSYHAGIESTIQDYFRAGATVFYHEMKNEMVYELNPDTGNDIFINRGKIKRNGTEITVETVPFYNVSGKAGFAYVRRTDIEEETYNEKYSYNLSARYDDKRSFSAQLDGRYFWWDYDFTGTKYNTFIWDLNLNKKIQIKEKIKPEIFLVAHNIFNATRYSMEDRKNPRRWIEAGIRVSF
ncbi:MAG: TonB-dependent receptor, partial [Nitrospirota bacterium]